MSSEWEPISGETPIDPSGLKNKSIKTRRQLIPLEAENIRQATVKYLAARPSESQTPFTFDWLLRVHVEMFGDVWKWAGTIRRKNLNIGIPFSQIGERLGGLALDIQAWEKREDLLLEQSVAIHHQTVQIHPFENGNGRWSRLLANIWLRRHGKPVVEWPEAEVGQQASPIRDEYIKAIVEADNHNREPLTKLHSRYWATEE